MMEQQLPNEKPGEIFDMQVLKRNFSDVDGEINVEAFSRCQEVFGSLVDSRLAALGDAIEAQKKKDIEMIAHQLKGSFLVLGGSSLADACQELELESDSLEKDKMKELHHYLQTNLPIFRAELSKVAARLSA